MDLVHFNAVVVIMTILTLAAGIFCGINFHTGNTTAMFEALGVGFVFLCIDYYFIEKRDEYIAGGKVPKY